MRPSTWRWPAALLALLALALLLAAPAGTRAVERRTGDTVVVAAGEVIEDDLVAAADTVIINGTVTGDVVAAAQSVEINGTVGGDLLAMGGGVTVNGTVDDDVRVGAAVLTLGSRAIVGDDLLSGGMSLELKPGAMVGGTLMFGGGQALLAGSVGDDVLFGGAGLELRGQVGGDVQASVGDRDGPAWASQVTIEGVPRAPEVQSGLTVADTARVAGDLAYTSASSFTLPGEAVAGKVIFNERPREAATPAQQPEHWLLEILRRYAALLLVGLLLVWLAPRFSRSVTAELEAQPLASLGWGFISIFAIALAFMMVPLVTVLLAVMLGVVKLTGLMGLVIAIGVLALLALIILTIIAIAYVAQIAASYELGRLILLRLRPAWTERPYAPLALGLAALVLLAAIPGVGWLFSTAAVLLGLGALWLLGRDTVQHRPIPVPA